AKGLTPVDWSSYLAQKRRWARSVLDIKFRVFPRIAHQLPRWERLTSLLHGLYYLQGLTIGLQLLLLVFMLVTGIVPSVVALTTAGKYAILMVVLQVCEFYRQRFYLNPRHEVGLHWRGGLLAIAKWPIIFVALIDAVRGKYGSYVITRKVYRRSRDVALLLPHGMVIVLVLTA
ncbi:MAG: hypothetical protein M3439_08590, partial [Chloroflexota bacterium]|nr:hypothetical protein [Chloroflexota bacterium]